MAGKGNFYINKSNKIYNINVIINVLPYDTCTHVVIYGFAKDKNEIENYFKHFEDPINIINLVEAWMVHGSDHWFLRPSVWQKINPYYQNKIMTDIFDESRTIGRLYEITIFNDLKRQIMDMLKDNFDNLNDDQKKMIVLEKAKLTDLIL